MTSAGETWLIKPYGPGNTSYKKLNVEELGQILKARGLDSPEELCRKALEKQDYQHAYDPFPFLSLPAELRDMIYGFAMAPDQPADQYGRISYDQRQWDNPCPPALARVNSQIRRESLAKYFACNEVALIITIPNHDLEQDDNARLRLQPESRDILQRLSAHTDLFREVVVVLGFFIVDESFEDIIHLPDEYNKLQSVDLRFRRDVKKTPQWTVTLFLPQAHKAILSREESHKVRNVLYMVGSHIGKCTEAIIEKFADPFAFTLKNVESLARRLPAEVSYDGTRRRIRSRNYTDRVWQSYR